MDVLFLPDNSRGNPYQRQLAEALGRYGVRVGLSNGIGYFPLLGAWRTCGKAPVLHMHWTDPFMASKLGGALVGAKHIRFVLELLSLKVRGTKVVWTVHNLMNHEQRNLRMELAFNRICARVYDQLIVHCRFAKEAVLQLYLLPLDSKDKIAVIPHGNYIAAYENSIHRKEARDCYGFEPQDTVFLFCGQIRPYKGVLHLMSAFGQLDDPRARLLIGGEPMNDAIRKELEVKLDADTRIHARLGFIPDNQIQIYMNAADVVVLPYRDVLTSGGALLAMSFGKAVIAPRLGCVPEIFDNGGGILYDPTREHGLLDAMRQALRAPLSEVGRMNFERAKQFDWKDIARKTQEVYQRCLA